MEREITKAEIMEHNRQTQIFWDEYDEWVKTEEAQSLLWQMYKIIRKTAKDKKLTQSPISLHLWNCR